MRTRKEYAKMVEERFEALLPATEKDSFALGSMPGLLVDSMRYSLLAGGKRLRPAMLLAACEMLGGDVDEALDCACALEMIHTYSLIHDDLPGMDNDELRRGKPTNHVVYGVGQAILAGDGLLNLAYEVMLANAARHPAHLDRHMAAISEIARGAGVTGMIAGQVADLYAEGKTGFGEDMLTYIHLGKTAAMFRGAMRGGARLAGADEKTVNALSEYADAFGLLFQASDDVLDITASAEFGKSKGKDERDGKLTAVSVWTLEGAQAHVRSELARAERALDGFGAEADFFRALADEAARRDH
ncbi:MAG: polyprenyl synthetase family protein [Clostridia bacterium]|nr:polyprenyl synthetase family protein [Clostridia bacterium]